MDYKGTILLADDEPNILEILSFNLLKEGYLVLQASNGLQAIDQINKHRPNLAILDIMMPYKTGIEVCNIIRASPDLQNMLVILLTAMNDENTQVRGLDGGADDYITKPTSPKIIVSRVNALFRRLGVDKMDKKVVVGNITIDPEEFVVIIDSVTHSLPKKEFALLYLLASKPGRVFLRNEILQKIWGSSVIVGDRTIDVHIRKIRQRLNIDCITTVKGVGYKFDWS